MRFRRNRRLLRRRSSGHRRNVAVRSARPRTRCSCSRGGGYRTGRRCKRGNCLRSRHRIRFRLGHRFRKATQYTLRRSTRPRRTQCPWQRRAHARGPTRSESRHRLSMQVRRREGPRERAPSHHTSSADNRPRFDRTPARLLLPAENMVRVAHHYPPRLRPRHFLHRRAPPDWRRASYLYRRRPQHRPRLHLARRHRSRRDRSWDPSQRRTSQIRPLPPANRHPLAALLFSGKSSSQRSGARRKP